MTKTSAEGRHLVQSPLALLSTRALVVDGEVRVLSIEEWESVAETASILSDSAAMEGLRLGITQLERGEGIPWEQLKAELGL